MTGATIASASGSAPGRVNLIGEHTDYNDGYVLPLAIPQRTNVEVRRREDDRVVVESVGMDPRVVEFRVGQGPLHGSWADYVRGTVAALDEAGFPVGGFDARVTSEVPVGSGLSSSAALLVAVLEALRTLWSLPFDDERLVALAHRAETGFVGVPVGILDPMACTFASEDTALFLDTRTLARQRVPLPRGAAIAVIDSGQRHAHASGEYRARRQECEEAARRLGVRALRDVTDPEAARTLPPPLGRRVRHVVTENARVLEAVAALRSGDVVRLGALFDASHASMRDDYECSTPGIDRLVDAARAVPGVHGARLTGGGFGGSIVLLADPARVSAAARATIDRVSGIPGLSPSVLVPKG